MSTEPESECSFEDEFETFEGEGAEPDYDAEEVALDE